MKRKQNLNGKYSVRKCEFNFHIRCRRRNRHCFGFGLFEKKERSSSIPNKISNYRKFYSTVASWPRTYTSHMSVLVCDVYSGCPNVFYFLLLYIQIADSIGQCYLFTVVAIIQHRRWRKRIELGRCRVVPTAFTLHFLSLFCRFPFFLSFRFVVVLLPYTAIAIVRLPLLRQKSFVYN